MERNRRSERGAGRSNVKHVVAPCRCGGVCRCGGLVPALLLRRLEAESEFYRRVM